MPATQQSSIAGDTIKWSQGMVVDRGWAQGKNLMAKYQKVYGRGKIIGSGFSIADGILVSDGVLPVIGIAIGEDILANGDDTARMY